MATAYALPGYNKTQSIIEPNGFDITVNFNSTLDHTIASSLVDLATGNTVTAIAGTAIAVNDTIALCKLPKGAVILDYFVQLPALDNGSVSLTLDFGLASTNSSTAGVKGATAATSNAAIFLAASTLGRAGGIVTPMESLGITGTTPIAPVGIVVGTGFVGVPLNPLIADDVLQLLAHAAGQAGGGAGGLLAGWVRYHCRGQVWTNS